jgi:rhamnogalacturonyl hydrolase YesR
MLEPGAAMMKPPAAISSVGRQRSRWRRLLLVASPCLALHCASSSTQSGGHNTGGMATSGAGGSLSASGGAGGATGGSGNAGGAAPDDASVVDGGALPTDGGRATAIFDADAGSVIEASTRPSDGSAGDARADAGPVVDPAPTLAIMRRVGDFELAKFGATFDNNWVRAVFYTGLMALYRATSDAKYLTAARNWGQSNAWGLGPDSNRDPRFADNQECVQTYAELYLLNPVPASDVMIASGRTVFDQMVAAPKAGRVEWWWCDALFMAPTALALVAKATGQTQYVDLMHTMWWDTAAFLYDPNQQLFWRDGTFVNTNTYWSRGNGWVLAGMTRVLDAIPVTDARRGDYESLFLTMSGKLRTLQGTDGFWRSNLINPAAFPNPESSGTAFFTYAMAWGIHHGILDRATFLAPVTRGWQALVGAVNAQGQLGWVQQVGLQPGPAAITDTNDYAAGAFLLAGNEMLKL